MAWFQLAANVDTAARRLFPKIGMRMVVIPSFLVDWDNAYNLRKHDSRVSMTWYNMVLKFSNEEMAEFLRGMDKPFEDRMDELLDLHGVWRRQGGVRSMVKWMQDCRDMERSAVKTVRSKSTENMRS